jgi:hypothetical protein
MFCEKSESAMSLDPKLKEKLRWIELYFEVN